jgi:hypothetical protein
MYVCLRAKPNSRLLHLFAALWMYSCESRSSELRFAITTMISDSVNQDNGGALLLALISLDCGF